MYKLLGVFTHISVPVFKKNYMLAMNSRVVVIIAVAEALGLYIHKQLPGRQYTCRNRRPNNFAHVIRTKTSCGPNKQTGFKVPIEINMNLLGSIGILSVPPSL